MDIDPIMAQTASATIHTMADPLTAGAAPMAFSLWISCLVGTILPIWMEIKAQSITSTHPGPDAAYRGRHS